MAYIGVGPNESVLVSNGTTDSFTTAPVMAGSFTSVGLINSGEYVGLVTATSTTPYVATATDYIIAMDSTGAIKTVQLPNAPTTGRIFFIKDAAGTAAAFNITVTTVGGAVLIDAAATYVINVAYQSVTVVFNGTKYLVL